MGPNWPTAQYKQKAHTSDFYSSDQIQQVKAHYSINLEYGKSKAKAPKIARQ
jgi:hypothetical protein